MTVIGLRVLCLFVALSAAAALLATDTLPVPTFNSSAYVSGAGGYQQVIYEDSMYNTTVTNMVWTRIHLEPCGMDLPQIHEGLSELTYIVSGTVVGAVITPGDNTGGFSTFHTGDVLAVSAGALHYAENPDCHEPLVLLQALSGGDRLQHTDILTSLFNLSPSSLEYGLNLTAEQVQMSSTSVRPVFALNQACLSRCGLGNSTVSKAG